MSPGYEDFDALPTFLAQVARRLAVVPPADVIRRFMFVSYLFEAFLKTVAIALIASLRETNKPAYVHHMHHLLQADSLGSWHKAVVACSSPPISAQIPIEYRPLLRWLTQKSSEQKDSSLYDAWLYSRPARKLIGAVVNEEQKRISAGMCLSSLIQIRNKTKGHGAFGEEGYEIVLEGVAALLNSLLESCPIVTWNWIYHKRDGKDQCYKLVLHGLTPTLANCNDAIHGAEFDRIYLFPYDSQRTFLVPSLLRTNAELNDFYFANGHVKSADCTAEFVSYGTGQTRREHIGDYALPPAELPTSETHAANRIDIQSNVFGNLPDLPQTYVRRPALEGDLLRLLRDRNHPIITLHGRGGIGKTSLALYVAHDLARASSLHFEQIVWVSARDIDLTVRGPRPVRQDVATVDDVARHICTAFELEPSTDVLAWLLQEPYSSHTNKGTLFIFDNFETFEDTHALHRYLDVHTHLPNKVLLTSRERAFKADYPVEVHGMERDEAYELARRFARECDSEPLITDRVLGQIYETTGGHPYLIKILIGEATKDRRFIPPPQVLSDREDILSALFERSFNKLSDSGNAIFLLVSNWKSYVPVIILHAVAGQRGIDVEAGAEECIRLSLLERYYGSDDVEYLYAPQVARIFGKKKIKGDPNYVYLRDDLILLQQFGNLSFQTVSAAGEEDFVGQLFARLTRSRYADVDEIKRVDRTLLRISEVWPYGWLALARFRREQNFPRDEVAYAYRRAMEENPFDPGVLEERADYSKELGDLPTEVTCLLQLVELKRTDSKFLSDVARRLTEFFREHREQLFGVNRAGIVAPVRQYLVDVVDQLSATELSRLAWLCLLEGNETAAREYAQRGYDMDRANWHCSNLLQRLESSRFK